MSDVEKHYSREGLERVDRVTINTPIFSPNQQHKLLRISSICQQVSFVSQAFIQSKIKLCYSHNLYELSQWVGGGDTCFPVPSNKSICQKYQILDFLNSLFPNIAFSPQVPFIFRHSFPCFSDIHAPVPPFPNPWEGHLHNFMTKSIHHTLQLNLGN